ncbi:SRPBCC domain-containing protein [Paenibacillus sp. XY044]|uniref:SRPBCC family protein n=1 Tax=Paenibacillus sp. XY044 TaxID=2026089 RepID=UPI000B98C207|nr:SRPBCC domain-containing protein [Paenibacillus sp. XY044]OZB91360.1 ATPase [Paenibacillus sp. XY044]
MVNTSTTTLTMKRRFDSTVERVFDAWVNPEMMGKWLFNPDENANTVKNNFRVGGSYSIIDPKGGEATGEYLEIDRPFKLVFTFQIPQYSETIDRITIILDRLDDGCEMSFTQEIVVPHEEGWTTEDIENAHHEFRDGSEQGWTTMFNVLVKHLSNNN